MITIATCESLSAIGSRILPRFDTILYFLAILPSIKSVNAAIIISTKAGMYFSLIKRIEKTGISAILRKLNQFGIVFQLSKSSFTFSLNLLILFPP